MRLLASQAVTVSVTVALIVGPFRHQSLPALAPVVSPPALLRLAQPLIVAG